MYITFNIKEHKVQYYQFLPQDWLKHRIYVGVSICKIKFKYALEQGLKDFQQIENIGYAMYGIGDINMTIIYGSLDYQFKSKYDQGITLSADSSLQEANINHQSEEGYYLLLMHRLEKANEQNWEKFDVTPIPAIFLAELGMYSIEKVVLSEPLELTYKDQSYSHTLAFTISVTNLIPKIDSKTLWSVGETYHTLKKLETINLSLFNRIELSLTWFLGCIEGSNVNKLISLWIAVEALILEGQTSLKPLRNALAQAYNIPVDKTESQFHVGKIFRLRSNVVHNGYKISIPFILIEYLTCLYKDLLNYSLSLPCAFLSETYIKENSPFLEYIKALPL
ncbi:hypothetical protein [Spirosoma koreense]